MHEIPEFTLRQIFNIFALCARILTSYVALVAAVSLVLFCFVSTVLHILSALRLTAASGNNDIFPHTIVFMLSPGPM